MSGDRRRRKQEKRLKQQRGPGSVRRSQRALHDAVIRSNLEENELVLVNFEIDFEPNELPHSPQIQDWAEEGFDALRNNRGRDAEVLFKKCLEVEETPDLMNNLAAAYATQGRHAESRAIASAVHTRWPDYFFGRIYMANVAVSERRFQAAEQYLRPMLMQQRFHISEFRALATAYIQLEIAQLRLEAAQSWADMWKSIEPEERDLKALQRFINASSARNRLLQLLRRRV